jgi:hypothetical protein
LAPRKLQLPGLIRDRNELSRLVWPPANRPPIPVLQEARKDGMKCQLKDNQGVPCQYIACQVRKIQEHCREKHGWENPQKKGRPEIGKEVEVPWRSGVHCQHFFIRGPGSQYFEVSGADRPPASQSPSADVGFEAAKQELEQALQRAEDQERRQITEPEKAKEPSGWLRRVGWAAHFWRV